MGENVEQNALPLLPDPVHPAGRLQITRDRTVNTKIECDGAFDRFDNFAKRNGRGGTAELIAAAGAAARAYQPPAHQIADDLLEIVFGDVLDAGNFNPASDALGMIGEMDHR